MPRPRKPTALLELSGAYEVNPGRRRRDPEVAGPIGEPPAHLAPDEAAAWSEFVQHAPPGVLSAGDRWVLEIGCHLMTRSRRGRLEGGLGGLLARTLGELGATPASRARVAPAAVSAPAGESPMERLAAMRRQQGKNPY